MPRKHSTQSQAQIVEKGAPRTDKPSSPAAGRGEAPVVSPEERLRMIAEAAYCRAEHRGFFAGCELEDWVQAGAEIDRFITAGGSRSRHSLSAV